METLGNIFADKSTAKFRCGICDYTTSHKGHYNEHINSSRHIRRKQNGNFGNMKIDQIDDNIEIQNICCKSCNKVFKSRSGLWKHKKSCNQQIEHSDKELINMLIKQNSELIKEHSEFRKEHSDIKELILEIVKNGTVKS